MSETKQEKKKMSPEQKKDLTSFLISFGFGALIALIASLLLYFRLKNLITPEEMVMLKTAYEGMPFWGIVCLIFTIVFFITGIILFFYYQKKYKAGTITKDVPSLIFKILVCAASSLMVITPIASKDNILFNIQVFFIAFACCYVGFSLFSKIKFITFKKVLWFPIALVLRFFIPLTFVLIFILGAINGLYPHDSHFLTDLKTVFGSDTYVPLPEGGSLGAIIGFACYKTVSSIYLLGQSRPFFMLGLGLLVILALLIKTFYDHFYRGLPIMSFVDDEPVEEVKAREDAAELESNKSFEQRKAEREALEKQEELEAKEAEDNFEVKLY